LVNGFYLPGFGLQFAPQAVEFHFAASRSEPTSGESSTTTVTTSTAISTASAVLMFFGFDAGLASEPAPLGVAVFAAGTGSISGTYVATHVETERAPLVRD